MPPSIRIVSPFRARPAPGYAPSRYSTAETLIDLCLFHVLTLPGWPCQAYLPDPGKAVLALGEARTTLGRPGNHPAVWRSVLEAAHRPVLRAPLD